MSSSVERPDPVSAPAPTAGTTLGVVLPVERLRRGDSAATILLFGAGLWAGALLMFLLEPMAAKMVLPRLGGAPAVWNTCVVFFQGMLLVGYAYSHAGPQWLGLHRH